MTMIDEAAVLKVEGQERSGRRLTDEHRALFRRLVLARRPGERFTINELRQALDSGGVPNAPRAALFAAAAAQGLIEQVRFSYRGETFPMQIPSTGRSAHRAYVLVWRRLPGPHDDAGGPP